MDWPFYLVGALVFVYFVYRYLPVYAWFYAKLAGVDLTIGDFVRLNWRCGKPMAILRPLVAARGEGITDVTVTDLEELYLIMGDVKPFLYGLLALRKSEFKHLTVEQVKKVCLSSGPGFKDLFFRSKKREELQVLKMPLVTEDGACLASAVRMDFQMELAQLLEGSRYTTDELLKRHVEKVARGVAWTYPSAAALIEGKAAVETACAEQIARVGGVKVHEFRFTRLVDTGKRVPKAGMCEDLFDKLKDEMLLDRSINLDNEIDDQRIKRKRG